jgi:peptidoglycan hydrolase-like protein with peptidoglycan-binding domain
MSRIDKNLTAADRRGNAVIEKAIAKAPLAQGKDQAAVKWMERMLTLAGFGVGAPDTRFGTRTAEALEAFQASVGLPATGELDAKSFEKLKSVEIRVRNHPKDEFVSTGQAGKRVLDAETKLRRLGYDVGAVDGVFDARDAKAIQAFRADQKELRDGNGILSGAVAKSLSREVNALSHEAYRARVATSKPRVRLDKLTGQEVAKVRSDGTVGVREGDLGRAVANIQAHLESAGFDPHGKGRFDERTRAMVEIFQRREGLPVTGVVDPKTWAKLDQSQILAKNGTSPAQSEGEKSRAVKHTEKLLRTLGYKHVKADGFFDDHTGAAVKAFEKKHHLKVDGAVGAKDLESLERAAEKASTPGLDPKKMPAQFRKWIPYVEKAAKRYHLPPSLLMAVMSRETNGHNVVGDYGHGRGLMQIDDRSWGSWLSSHHGGMDPASNIMKGAEILRGNIDYFHGNVRYGVAAYNCGAGNVSSALAHGHSCDYYTANGNYSADVLHRRKWFV